MSIQNEPTSLECCACGEKRKFGNGDDIYVSNWALHRIKDKCVDLCPSCAKRQDGRDEQERQILGLPPQRIEPMKKNSEITPSLTPSLVPAMSRSGITVRAVFNLVRIDAIVGDNVISGEELPLDATEVVSNIDGKSLVIGNTYYVKLI